MNYDILVDIPTSSFTWVILTDVTFGSWLEIHNIYTKKTAQEGIGLYTERRWAGIEELSFTRL